MNLSAISLYTGAGGLDYGFEAAGFRTRVCVELDHASCETLRRNRDWPIIESDIERVPSEEILEIAALQPGEADVLIGGPPCQPFSKAGYWAFGDSKRMRDPRAATIGNYLRVLEETLPKTFLLENVPGLSFSGKDEGLQFLRQEIDRINERTRSNYRLTVRQLNAADYGVPQVRHRVFVVGDRQGRIYRFPAQTHGESQRDIPLLAQGELKQFVTAWDALWNVQPLPDEQLTVTGKWADLLPSIPEGQNYLHHTDRGAGIPLFGWRRRYWSFLLKLAKQRPAWTIPAQPGPATGPFHWANRLLSQRELSRLQTFPADFIPVGARREVQKQLGNAVPSLLAEIIAREMAKQLLEHDHFPKLPRLTVERSPIEPPAPQVSDVPAKYLSLAGEHTPHPGTGMGYSYAAR